ncbi:MAG TPA: YceI family protein [Mucilaginibacter sp.]|jgi:polyisoprenoid-binding protein YceI|nr:YceI family protein [Mucilaginibacter sp.]
MKKLIYPAAFAVAGLLAFTLATITWKVNSDQAEVKFTSDKVDGSFTGLKASIVFDEQHPEEAKLSATIDATSVATGFFLKSMHARDALGSDTYPTIKFESTAVSKNGNGYVAKGNLTLKGATRPEAIYFTFTAKGNQGVFKGNMTVVPKDFGIDHNGTPPKVMISLTVPVSKM